MGGMWGAEGGFFHTVEQKSSHCVLMELQKGTVHVLIIRLRRSFEAVSH